MKYLRHSLRFAIVTASISAVFKLAKKLLTRWTSLSEKTILMLSGLITSQLPLLYASGDKNWLKTVLFIKTIHALFIVLNIHFGVSEPPCSEYLMCSFGIIVIGYAAARELYAVPEQLQGKIQSFFNYTEGEK